MASRIESAVATYMCAFDRYRTQDGLTESLYDYPVPNTLAQGPFGANSSPFAGRRVVGERLPLDLGIPNDKYERFRSIYSVGAPIYFRFLFEVLPRIPVAGEYRFTLDLFAKESQLNIPPANITTVQSYYRWVYDTSQLPETLYPLERVNILPNMDVVDLFISFKSSSVTNSCIVVISGSTYLMEDVDGPYTRALALDNRRRWRYPLISATDTTNVTGNSIYNTLGKIPLQPSGNTNSRYMIGTLYQKDTAETVWTGFDTAVPMSAKWYNKENTLNNAQQGGEGVKRMFNIQTRLTEDVIIAGVPTTLPVAGLVPNKQIHVDFRFLIDKSLYDYDVFPNVDLRSKVRVFPFVFRREFASSPSVEWQDDMRVDYRPSAHAFPSYIYAGGFIPNELPGPNPEDVVIEPLNGTNYPRITGFALNSIVTGTTPGGVPSKGIQALYVIDSRGIRTNEQWCLCHLVVFDIYQKEPQITVDQVPQIYPQQFSDTYTIDCNAYVTTLNNLPPAGPTNLDLSAWFSDQLRRFDTKHRLLSSPAERLVAHWLILPSEYDKGRDYNGGQRDRPPINLTRVNFLRDLAVVGLEVYYLSDDETLRFIVDRFSVTRNTDLTFNNPTNNTNITFFDIITKNYNYTDNDLNDPDNRSIEFRYGFRNRVDPQFQVLEVVRVSDGVIVTNVDGYNDWTTKTLYYRLSLTITAKDQSFQDRYTHELVNRVINYDEFVFDGVQDCLDIKFTDETGFPVEALCEDSDGIVRAVVTTACQHSYMTSAYDTDRTNHATMREWNRTVTALANSEGFIQRKQSPFYVPSGALDVSDFDNGSGIGPATQYIDITALQRRTTYFYYAIAKKKPGSYVEGRPVSGGSGDPGVPITPDTGRSMTLVDVTPGAGLIAPAGLPADTVLFLGVPAPAPSDDVSLALVVPPPTLPAYSDLPYVFDDGQVFRVSSTDVVGYSSPNLGIEQASIGGTFTREYLSLIALREVLTGYANTGLNYRGTSISSTLDVDDGSLSTFPSTKYNYIAFYDDNGELYTPHNMGVDFAPDNFTSVVDDGVEPTPMVVPTMPYRYRYGNRNRPNPNLLTRYINFTGSRYTTTVQEEVSNENHHVVVRTRGGVTEYVPVETPATPVEVPTTKSKAILNYYQFINPETNAPREEGTSVIPFNTLTTLTPGTVNPVGLNLTPDGPYDVMYYRLTDNHYRLRWRNEPLVLTEAQLETTNGQYPEYQTQEVAGLHSLWGMVRTGDTWEAIVRPFQPNDTVVRKLSEPITPTPAAPISLLELANREGVLTQTKGSIVLNTPRLITAEENKGVTYDLDITTKGTIAFAKLYHTSGLYRAIRVDNTIAGTIGSASNSNVFQLADAPFTVALSILPRTYSKYARSVFYWSDRSISQYVSIEVLADLRVMVVYRRGNEYIALISRDSLVLGFYNALEVVFGDSRPESYRIVVNGHVSELRNISTVSSLPRDVTGFNGDILIGGQPLSGSTINPEAYDSKLSSLVKPAIDLLIERIGMYAGTDAGTQAILDANAGDVSIPLRTSAALMEVVVPEDYPTVPAIETRLNLNVSTLNLS